MNIDTLDLLLKYFYDNRNVAEQSLFDQIRAGYNKVNPPLSVKELLILLYKLVDDGYVTKKPSNAKRMNSIGTEILENFDRPLFYISFKGILFFEKPFLILKERPYRYMWTIDNMRQTYTAAKIIMTVISTSAIILISYLTYKVQDKPIIVNAPVKVIQVIDSTQSLQVRDTVL